MVAAQEGGSRETLSKSLAAAVTVAVVFAAANAPTPLYVQWQNEWGFSSGTLTVVFAVYMIGLVGTLLFAGRIADLHGRRVVLIPGLLIAMASSLCFLFASDVSMLVLGRFGAGIAGGAIVTAGMASVVDLAPRHLKSVGSLLSSVSMVLGVGFGALLAGGFATILERPQTVVFGILTGLTLAGLMIAILLPLRGAGRTTNAAPRSIWPSFPPGHRRELIWGIAAFGPGITATSLILSLAPSVLADVLDESSPLVSGIVVCFTFVSAISVQIALARLSTRQHLLLSSIAAVLAMLLLGIVVVVFPSVILFGLMAVLAGSAQGLGQLAGFTLIGTRIPAENRAESNAILNIGVYIPAAALPVITGYLADLFGLAIACLVYAVIVGSAAAVAAPTVWRSLGRHPAPRDLPSTDGRH